jgi:hypothetical protein
MLGGLKLFFLQKVNLRGADNNLDYLKVVHVLILRPHSSRQAFYKKSANALARPFDHWIPDEERAQELVLSRCRLMNACYVNACQFLKRDGFILPTHKTDRQNTGSLFALQARAALADHVHEFDAGQDIFGGSNDLKLSIGLLTRLTAQWSCSTMLRYFTCRTTIGFLAGIDGINAALLCRFVHRDPLRNTAGPHGFVKEAQGCGPVALGSQQEVDRFTLIVYRAVEILPGARP